MRNLLMAGIFAGTGLLLAQTTHVKKAPVTATSPASGKDMFVHYCASCHGKDGKGGGPAAPALKPPPSDLTALTAKNKGKFPDLRVSRVIEGSDDLVAHGSRDMPIWGEVFREMDGNGAPTAKIRVANLTAYIQSIQGK